MRELKIATGDSRYQKTWVNTETTWPALVERLSSSIVTSETAAEYAQMPKTQQSNIKDVGGFIGGHLADGRRKRGSVLSRSMLTLDLDYCDTGTLVMLEITCDWEALIYSTHKHTDNTPRLRLVLPLTRDVTEEEYEPLGRMVAKQLGFDYFDETTFQAQRLMYWPSTPADVKPVLEVLEGPWLDPDEVLGRYDDWRDVTTWPAGSTTVNPPKAMQAEDPTTKDGLVGAFCRTYGITDAIETYLDDAYAPTSNPDRFDYVAGESSSGVVIYDNLWSYSHHATDPAGGQLVNAFDLVRLHRFSGLDADAKPETPTNRLPSYTAMLDLARNDDAVRSNLAAEKLVEAKEEFGEWESALTFDRKGGIEATLPNLVLILENDPALRSLALDELWDTIVVRDRAALPWAMPSPYWRDTDDAQLAVYVETRYARFTQRDLLAALSAVTDRRRFHPVLDYLQSLPEWDGVGRADTLLVDYLGAEDSAYTRAVTRKTLCAAVRRVKQPGTKFDTMLVLAGPQGIGKSTIAARLGGSWFNDSLSMADTRDKTAAEKLQGFWIQEFGELAGLRKAEVEAMRSFLSRQDDVYRGSYDRRVSRHPRQCVFIGTTNAESGFLTDPAGNRRFWPVNTPGGGRAHPWDLTGSVVDQVWAEVLLLEEEGEKLYLEGDLAAESVLRQREAIEVDERSGAVREYLDTPLPEDWEAMSTAERYTYLGGSDFEAVGERGGQPRDQVSVIEVWCECFGNRKGDLSRRESNAIANMLRRLGWVSTQKTQRVRPYGVQKMFDRRG